MEIFFIAKILNYCTECYNIIFDNGFGLFIAYFYTKNMKEEWINPDDAPEADGEWFKNAHVYIGDTLIKRGAG